MYKRRNNEFVTSDASPTLRSTASRSLSLWFKQGTSISVGHNDSSLVSYGGVASDKQNGARFEIVLFGGRVYGSFGPTCNLAGDTYTVGKWTHVLFTYDSQLNVATVYVDGGAGASGTPACTVATQNTPLVVGESRGALDFYAGYIAHVSARAPRSAKRAVACAPSSL